MSQYRVNVQEAVPAAAAAAVQGQEVVQGQGQALVLAPAWYLLGNLVPYLA
jgi:hypothetical protein